jgi:hypothetical protein
MVLFIRGCHQLERPHMGSARVYGAMLPYHLVGYLFEATIDSERCCEPILYPSTGHLNEGDNDSSCFRHNDATAYVTHVFTAFLLPCVRPTTNFNSHQGRLLTVTLIFICGEPWKLQCTKTTPAVSVIRKKPLLIWTETFSMLHVCAINWINACVYACGDCLPLLM